jgi:hypothetical protein
VPSAPRKLRRPEKSAGRACELQIRKTSPGRHRPIEFSQMDKGQNSDRLNTEEFVSGLNWRAHGRDNAREAVKPRVVDEANLQDFIRKAPNSCSKCFGPRRIRSKNGKTLFHFRKRTINNPGGLFLQSVTGEKGTRNDRERHAPQSELFESDSLRAAISTSTCSEGQRDRLE